MSSEPFLPYRLIVELFVSIQSIRRKYPIAASYAKNLQKPADDDAKAREIEQFRKFLIRNRSAPDHQLIDWYYQGVRNSTAFCFENVVKLGTPETIDEFWTKMTELKTALFPDGMPPPTDAEIDPSAALLENNPIFADIIDKVRSTVEKLDGSDLSTIIQSPDFGNLVTEIKKGLKSGKYKLSELTKALGDALSTMTGDVAVETKDALNMAMNMVAAAERGQAVDVQKLMNLMQHVKF